MGLAGVLVDAGNTLVEWDYPRLAEVLKGHDLAVDAATLRLAEQHVRPALDAWLARGRSTESADAMDHYLGLVLEVLGAEPGASASLAARLRERGEPDWRVPAPGAAQALGRLAAMGLRIAVVSNSDGSVRAMLADLGLLDHVAAVLDSRVVGVEKPDPRIFALALEAIGVEPAQALHVGDLPSIDGQGARAAGVGFVLVDPAGVFGVEPSIRDIAELPDCGPVRAGGPYRAA
ncbi:MAG: HAD-IA family hydrolase [Planctomycetes bacterium]|nr:HAD-IA family hydrolase [Planctomycetota bacterium]